MRTPFSHSQRLLSWLLLLGALFVLLHRIDSGAVPKDRLFHPEALYPAALYLDLANWTTWNTPFSPYLLPDLPLFFLCQWLSPSPTAAIYAFAALQLVLLVFGLRLLVLRILVDDPRRHRAARLTVLAGAALALALAANLHGRGLLLHLLAAAFHTGAFLLAIYLQALLLQTLHRTSPERPQGRRLAGLACLLVLTCLGTFSDLLLLPLFVVPAAGALVLARHWRLALGLLASGLVGMAAIPTLNALGGPRVATFAPISPGHVLSTLLSLPSREDAPLAFVRDRFFEGFGTLYRAGWLAWLAATVLFTLVLWTRKREAFADLPPRSRANLRLLLTLTLASFATTAAGAMWIAIGRYGVDAEHLGTLFVNRYLSALYTLPLLTPALYLTLVLSPRRAATIERLATAILSIILVVGLLRLDWRAPFPSHRPDDVACLDALAEEHGWRNGLAFYHGVRRIDVFSRHGLHADGVTERFEPIDWIASRRRATRYDFVVLQQIRDAATVEAKLGRPDHVFECPGTRVYGYATPRPFPSAALTSAPSDHAP